MRLTRSIAAVTFATLAATSPIGNTHSLHEKRSEIPPGWERLDTLDRRAVLPLKIGLAQSNLDKGWEWLNDVSHPSSPNYSKHWTPEQVARAFSPSDESLDAVRSWLSSSGIASDRLTQSRSLSWLEFEASVGEAEELLKTKYHVYEHGQSGQLHVASEEYSVPSHLKEHIDIITPTVHFDVKVKPRKSNPELAGRDESSDVRKGLGWPGSGSLPKGGRRLGPNGPLHGKKLREELAMCDEYITPDCLRALYQFPINHKLNKDNSYGIVEYTPQAYVPGDLDLFFANFSKHQVGDRPILDSVDGGVVQQNSMGFEYNGESDLDLEYAMALVYPQPVTCKLPHLRSEDGIQLVSPRRALTSDPPQYTKSATSSKVHHSTTSSTRSTGHTVLTKEAMIPARMPSTRTRTPTTLEPTKARRTVADTPRRK